MMSTTSILLLLDDGEMHPFVPNSSGGLTSPGGGNLVLTTSRSHSGGGSDTPTLTYTVDGNIITTESGETISLGSHFLTADNEIQPKIEVDGISMPVEVVVDKSGQAISYKKNRKFLDASLSPSNTIPGVGAENDKKVCLWPTGNGTTCGKTFTKYDSLKRHLTETHKGVRPYACSMCDKTYGRRDYLQRHLKSHNASYALNLAGGGGSSTVLTSNTVTLVNSLPTASANSMVQKIKISPQTSNNVQIVQMPQTVQNLSGVQIIQHSASGTNTVMSPTTSHHAVVSPPSPGSNSMSSGSTPLATTQLPFFTLNGSLPQASKPMGSKICRWVQNDGTVCGKAFSKLDSLRRHVNELHKGVRPFACPLCEKSYGRRDYLDRHMKTHEKKNKSSSGSGMEWDDGVLLTGDEMPPPPPKIPKKKRKDIPAEEKKICLWILDDGTACGKTFTKFDSLKRHVSEAHKQIRPYCCTLCGKNYGRRDYLLRHLRSHNDVEVSNLNIAKVTNNPSTGNTATIVAAPNPMPGQSSSSISLSQLPAISTNQLGGILPPSHTSNASSNAGLSGHRMAPTIAGKKRPADDKKTCKWVLDNGTICGRTFSKFDSLRRHVAELHKGIRPFVCEICQKSYGRRDYLDRHIRSAHKEGCGAGGDSDGITEMTTHELDEALDGATIVTVGGTHDEDDDDEDGHHHHIIKTDPTDLEEVILPSVVTVVTSDGM